MLVSNLGYQVVNLMAAWRGDSVSLTGSARRWSRFLVMLGVGVGCDTSGQQVAAPPTGTEKYRKLEIDGDDLKNGPADVSVKYDDDGVGWLVYSVVGIPQFVETHLAKSKDHGATWSFVSIINRAHEETVRIGTRDTVGIWRHETPALVRDPDDVGKEWKLFWHKYFVKPPYREQDRDFSQSWIAYRHAPHPEGPWSEEIRLFGSKGVSASVDINPMHPDLRNIAFYMEPGVLVDQGVLYVSLDTCTTRSGLGDWRNRRIILVASTDHGQTWSYVGTLTDGDDARQFGYVALTASSLVRDKDRLYLLLTPSGSLKKRNKAHDGTLVVPFQDIARAELERDASGKIVTNQQLACRFDSGGQSDYDGDNHAGGMLMSQVNLKSLPGVFQVWSTNQGIAAE